MTTPAYFTRDTFTKRRLYAEFVIFYILSPIGIAVFLPAGSIIPALIGFSVIGLVLLHRTPYFAWGQLHFGWSHWNWRELALFSAGMALLCYTVISLTRPEDTFALLKENPWFLLIIWVFYPFVSALPQELLFRVLFYRRYLDILPSGRSVHLLNAAFFSFAHLMYWSWVVALMTFIGSLIFSWAYMRRQSFVYAVILHGLSGNIIFLMGLGVYFYMGNVEKPF